MKKLVLLLLVSTLMACRTAPSGLDKYEGQDAQKIFANADIALSKQNYPEAIGHYEALQALYPYGEHAEQTLLNAIYAYYCAKEYDALVSAADHYARLYVNGAHTDYVYYIKALAVYNRNVGFLARYFSVDVAGRNVANVEQSFNELKELVIRFPHSLYAEDARQRMVFLRNTLANQQLKIANYYYARKAWLSAAEYATNVVTTYQNTPQVEAALELMLKSYQQLGLSNEACAVTEVLQANYPNRLQPSTGRVKKVATAKRSNRLKTSAV